jgi:spore germination protein
MDELMQKLSAGAYYGVQLCFNYLFPFDKDNYSAFAEALSNTLHKAGFILSVELAPRDSAALSAGQDYAALGAAADRLSLMFCRWAHPFSPPQAMAGLDALHRALSEATAAIPAKKLLLGISGKGYDWFLPWRQGDSAKPLSNLRAPELAAAMASEIKRDKSSGAPYFLYRDAEQKRHIVFYEDYISLSEKLSLVSQYGLCGLSLYSAECFSAPALQLITQRYSAEKLL